jgi:hypothetical protein
MQPHSASIWETTLTYMAKQKTDNINEKSKYKKISNCTGVGRLICKMISLRM